MRSKTLPPSTPTEVEENTNLNIPKLILRIGVTLVIAIFIFGSGIAMGYILRDIVLDNQPTQDEQENFALYWEVWHRVEEKFYNDIPETSDITYGAIRGALATLNDPYTIFIEPEPAAKEKAQLEGQFGGIGAFVRTNDEGQILLEPMRDQAAEKAGLQVDDILIAVDGQTITPEMSVDEIVSLIRGEVGTEVVLTVERAGEAEPIDIPIERAIIETPSAHWRILEEHPTIGYVQLTSFTERSHEELIEAFQELSDQEAETYILDLRGNGGGLLEAAIDISSQFLDEGLVLTEDRKGEGERIYDVRDNGPKVLESPLVILVNGGTASASEIVAGALQDHQRATLIGEKSFGKGSVQLIYELSDNSRLHVTVAKWFTPDGHAIDGKGLDPDIESLPTEEDRAAGRDAQLERAISFLQNGE